MRNTSMKLAALAVVAIAGIAPAAPSPVVRAVDNQSAPFAGGPTDLNVRGSASATALHGPDKANTDEAMLEARLNADLVVFGKSLRMADVRVKARNWVPKGKKRESSATLKIQIGGYVVDAAAKDEVSRSFAQAATLDRSKKLKIPGAVSTDIRAVTQCMLSGNLKASAVRPAAPGQSDATYARIAGDARAFGMSNLSTSHKSTFFVVTLFLAKTVLDAKLLPDYTAEKHDHYGAVRCTVAPANFAVRITVLKGYYKNFVEEVLRIRSWKESDYKWLTYSLAGIDKFLCQRAAKK